MADSYSSNHSWTPDDLDISPDSRVSNQCSYILSSENSVQQSELVPSNMSSIEHFREISNKERESSLVPAELAKSQIKKIENEMKKMHQKHCHLLKDMDENYATIEKETHQRYIEFIHKWKDQVKQRIEQYRKVIDSLNIELTEIKDYAETNISSLQQGINKLQYEKNELLLKYDRDLLEKEITKEKAISSMQSSYEKQIDAVQHERQELMNAIEEIMAEKENAERYSQQLLDQYTSRDNALKQATAERDSLESQVISLTLDDLITQLELPQANTVLSRYHSVKGQYEELKKERLLLKSQVTH